MKKFVTYILLILNLFITEAGNYRFSNFQSHSYVPYSNINDMQEDEFGFLWIATENGLVRFDGYEYTLYQQSKTKSYSLPNNNCRQLLIDSKKRLWVGTDNGIALFDREHDRFIVKPLSEARVSSRNIVGIGEEKDGSIWVQSFRELIKLTFNGELDQVYAYPDGVCMHMESDCIWLGSLTYGLHKFDKKSGVITPVTFDQLPKEKRDLHVRTIFKASDGSLLIGTRDMGLLVYNEKENRLSTYSSSNYPNYFKSDFVLSLMEDSNHNIWVGSVNGQLIQYELKTGKLKVPFFKYPSGVDLMTIGCTVEDSQKNIWVGTHHYWIYQCNRSSNEFNHYQHQSGQSNSLSHNAVTSFADFGSGILIGTDGGGLNIMDKKTGIFHTEQQFGKIVLDIKAGNSANEYWIATWGSNAVGLVQYNIANKTSRNYKFQANDPNAITSSSLRTILVDGKYVWVGTDGGGVCRLNTETSKIDNRNNSKEPIFSAKNPQWVNHLMKDKKGRMWLSTSEGLILYKDNICQPLQIGDLSKENIQNEVRMTMEDDCGNIWVATASNGLNLFVEEDKSFKNISKAVGLPMGISSICMGDSGRIWIASMGEMIIYDHKTGKSTHHYLKNDLNGNPFTSNAIYCSNGKVYVGSNNGFFELSPSELSPANFTPKVYLKDLYIWGQKQTVSDSSTLKKSLQFCDTIQLQHSENSFSIDYFGLDFENAESLNYAYYLEGFHSDWIDAGKVRQAYFTNLSPGKYIFHVRSKSIDDQATINAKPLTIIILPPWWQTWWARLLTGSIIILGLIMFFYIRDKKMKDKQAELERLVTQRTEELNQKNAEVQEQKENLEIQNQRLDESLSTKNKILSVIAHDLRNPLTAIIGNLTLMGEDEKLKESSSRIKQVCKSAKDLQNQMENLLDWARLQNQSILYSPKECFLDALCKECITLLQSLFKEKKINVTLTNEAQTSAFIDQRMISTVYRNLISNAIKFTNEGGSIDLHITEDDEFIHWNIQDNGVGMTEEQCQNLFRKDYTTTTFGTKNEKGSGLGLKICKEFISLNKGTLKISSQVGEGTKICISLPKGSLHHEEKNNQNILFEEPSIDTTSTERKSHLLVVDDNPEILSFLCELLRTTYDISHASNGEDALSIAQKEIPDLIISDVVMPKMNGRELCFHIKKDDLTKHIPVVLLTSEDTIEDQVEGLNIGADDYITKPFNENILKAKVATILKNKELQRDHLRTRILHMPEIEIPENRDDQFIRKINDIIKDNIAESSLTVEFLADKTALSRVQLFRKMKAITGCTPSEYIKAIRLEHAAEVLRESKQNIADIAYSIGFTDPKYFSSCFSDKFGETPSQYAKKFRGNI